MPDRRVGQRGRFERRGTGWRLAMVCGVSSRSKRLASPPEGEVEFEPVATVARRGAAQIGREGEAQRIPAAAPASSPPASTATRGPTKASGNAARTKPFPGRAAGNVSPARDKRCSAAADAVSTAAAVVASVAVMAARCSPTAHPRVDCQRAAANCAAPSPPPDWCARQAAGSPLR